jgi:microcompartment protein CcmL/EutN
LAAAIEAADSMLKCADVRLLRQLLREPMLITITVEGELGACRAAVDAGQASATRMGAFIASSVMGRPANDTADFVLELAEAGSKPFGQRPSAPKPEPELPSTELPSAEQQAALDARLLALLVGLPGGYGAQSLARHIGGTLAAVRQRLEALFAQGKLVKRHGRYILAEPGGDEK